VPVNSFEKNKIRKADLGTKNMQHYRYHEPHTKAAEKLMRNKTDFANWGLCQYFPYKQQKFPHGNIFISPTETLEICWTVKKKATPYNLVYARLNFVEPCFSSQNEVRCAIDTGFSEEYDNTVLRDVTWDNIKLCEVI
jgi:hypothetical protein